MTGAGQRAPRFPDPTTKVAPMPFYRLHWADCPPFTADNAWSALWGTHRTGDGSQVVCTQCGGRGRVFEFDEDNCDTCGGDGYEDCVRGYSACATAADLIAYITSRHLDVDAVDGIVIVFDGTEVGTGPDGEPLAVPTRVVEMMTWAELVARG